MTTPSKTVLSRRDFSALLGAAGVTALGLGLSGCSDNKGGTAGGASEAGDFPLGKTQIQALGAGVCGAPAYVAKDKGFFADEGIDVELVSGTFEQQKSGLESGQYLLTTGDFQFFPAVDQGLKVKIIAGLHEGCIKMLVPADSPIKTIADLKGKKIGVDEVGGTPWAIASVALANAGVDPNVDGGEVTWAVYDLSVLEDAALSGEIDAFSAWDPFATIAENHGLRVLVDIAEGPIFGGKSCCFLYASDEAIEKNPEKVKALYGAWIRAVEWIANNPEEAAQIITDGSQHEPYEASEELDLIVDLLKGYHFAGHHDASNAQNPKDDAEYFAEQLKKTGYLPADLDTKQFVEKIWYDPSQL